MALDYPIKVVTLSGYTSYQAHMDHVNGNQLGDYLRSRRTKLDPASLGFSSSRRRTPGLRREEVAQRANISAAWYTLLEQGRGGNPSANVLERIAKALMLTEFESEHLFLIGLGRPPNVRYRNDDTITPRLQRVLDVMLYTPALIRTATWDVVGWNKAMAAVFIDYGALPPGQRNVLRMVFCDPRFRAAQADWESVARYVVGVFRIDAARAGAMDEVEPLVRELCLLSPEFAAMWRDNDVQADGGGIKRLRHPVLGSISLEYSTFAVDGRPDLQMVVYNPVTPTDQELIRALIERAPAITFK